MGAEKEHHAAGLWSRVWYCCESAYNLLAAGSMSPKTHNVVQCHASLATTLSILQDQLQPQSPQESLTPPRTLCPAPCANLPQLTPTAVHGILLHRLEVGPILQVLAQTERVPVLRVQVVVGIWGNTCQLGPGLLNLLAQPHGPHLLVQALLSVVGLERACCNDIAAVYHLQAVQVAEQWWRSVKQ